MTDKPVIPHLEAYTTPDDHTTVVGSLDLSTEADRKTLRRSIATANPEHKVQRWGGLDDNLRKQAVKAQAYALKLATERGSVREIDSCVRTLAMLEGQQQADEHLAEKNARLDEGKATENLVQRQYVAEFDGGTKL